MTCIYFRQAEARGLGHAVSCAVPLIEDEPFAVILADDLMEGPTPVLSQLIKAYASTGESMIAVNAVHDHEISNYGVVDVDDPGKERFAKLRGIVEKPAADHARSNLAVVGRYVLDGAIMEILKQQKPGRSGENPIDQRDRGSGATDRRARLSISASAIRLWLEDRLS